mmetsp:Transcript_11431/g.32450  ORF Transcript_11431/g.32450 Transcript_11431/m.32450 type:complete len:272 (+) Transcript_11431:1546-2361(+)
MLRGTPCCQASCSPAQTTPRPVCGICPPAVAWSCRATRATSAGCCGTQRCPMCALQAAGTPQSEFGTRVTEHAWRWLRTTTQTSTAWPPTASVPSPSPPPQGTPPSACGTSTAPSQPSCFGRPVGRSSAGSPPRRPPRASCAGRHPRQFRPLSHPRPLTCSASACSWGCCPRRGRLLSCGTSRIAWPLSPRGAAAPSCPARTRRSRMCPLSGWCSTAGRRRRRCVKMSRHEGLAMPRRRMSFARQRPHTSSPATLSRTATSVPKWATGQRL